MDKIEKLICDIIDEHSEEIIAFGRDIWHHAEVAYQEVRTAEKFEESLNKLGITTENKLAITGVKGYLKPKGSEGPTVCLMGEMDALPISNHPDANPETGASHACGHHAQITGVIGAAIALSVPEVAEQLGGNVVFFGMPAEEAMDPQLRKEMRQKGLIKYGAGKCELICAGHMDDVDIAIGHHGNNSKGINVKNFTNNGVISKSVTYTGRAAHAAANTDAGIDALAAASLAMHAVDLQRESFRNEDVVRVHGYVVKNASAVNVIADDVVMEYSVRAKTIPAIKDASAKVDRALRAGAVATGCGLTIETTAGCLPRQAIKDFSLIKGVCDLFADKYPIKVRGAEFHGAASGDTGDVSSVMPLMIFETGGFVGNTHTPDIYVADEYLAYVMTAKIFALTAYRLLKDGGAEAKRIKDSFVPVLTRQQYIDYLESMMSYEEIPMAPLPPVV